MIFKDIEATYPISPMQQGLLFHTLYAGERGSAYIPQIIFILREPMNMAVFQRAWQKILDRHAILRTSFSWDGNEPQQEVHHQVQLPLEEQDWREWSIDEKDPRLEKFLMAERRRGFDLSKAPLLRLSVLRIADARYVVVLTYHHALLDGRSRLLLIKELFTFYDAYLQGQEVTLESPRSYRDYIEWLQQQDWSKAEAYWRQTLKGFTAPTPLLNLPPEKLPGSDEPDHDNREMRLSASLTASLQELALQHDVTLNTLFQAAWAILLARYSGETDVVFGVTRNGRKSTMAGAEAIIGLFINTLPVRAHVNPNSGLIHLLKELRTQSLAVRPYEHSPLFKVQQWSEMPRGVSLFDSVVSFQSSLPGPALSAMGCNWQNRDIMALENMTKFPLALSVYGGPELMFRLLYHPDQYASATIDRMLGHIKTLLEGIVSDPEQRLGSLPLLTEGERRQLLEEWNSR